MAENCAINMCNNNSVKMCHGSLRYINMEYTFECYFKHSSEISGECLCGPSLSSTVHVKEDRVCTINCRNQEKVGVFECNQTPCTANGKTANIIHQCKNGTQIFSTNCEMRCTNSNNKIICSSTVTCDGDDKNNICWKAVSPTTKPDTSTTSTATSSTTTAHTSTSTATSSTTTAQTSTSTATSTNATKLGTSPQLQAESNSTIIVLGTVAGVAIISLIVVLLLVFIVYRRHRKSDQSANVDYIDLNIDAVGSTPYAGMISTQHKGPTNVTDFQTDCAEKMPKQQNQVGPAGVNHTLNKNTVINGTCVCNTDDNTYNCIDEDDTTRESWYAEANDIPVVSKLNGQQVPTTVYDIKSSAGYLVLEENVKSSGYDSFRDGHPADESDKAIPVDNYFVLEKHKYNKPVICSAVDVPGIPKPSNVDLKYQGTSGHRDDSEKCATSYETLRDDYIVLQKHQGTDNATEGSQDITSDNNVQETIEGDDYDKLKHPARKEVSETNDNYDHIGVDGTRYNQSD